jgi:hypothetical protein
MTPKNKTKILSLINAYQLSEAFTALDKLNLQNPDYAKLKREFIAGIKTVDFVEQLIVLVNNIEIEGQNNTILKPNQTTTFENMKKMISNRLTITATAFILLLSLYWYLKTEDINKIEPLIGIIGSSLTLILGIFFSYEEKQIAKRKNVVEGTTLKGKNIHIGDTGGIDNQNYDEKNIVAGSNLEANGDIRIGDIK